ncbi:MAG TPA: hypothetical protein VK550_12445 [Polyangiaceae bacterium]|nr:hypothetical protein [Polyangiaceae bacterium]
MPDGLRKLKEDLAYAEAMAAKPTKKKATKKKAKPAKKSKKAKRPHKCAPRKAAPAPTPPHPETAKSGDCDLDLLSMALEVGVSLRIDQLKRESIDTILNPAEMAELADDIAFHADVVMYKSKKPGETARHFTRLVEAIARLAYVQGGIKFNGVRYEAAHGVA